MNLFQNKGTGISAEKAAPRNRSLHFTQSPIYPAEAYFHNNRGGSVLDITKLPFNAKGDGVSDDSY
jgi:hypothetical protein